VARVCLNLLRSRKARHEEPLDDVLARAADSDPEEEAMLADSVGPALLVVLDTLAPAERLAFVLHDLFPVPFDEIAPMLERSPAAARQLASRARRRGPGCRSGDWVLRPAPAAPGRGRVPGRRPRRELRGAADDPRPRLRVVLAFTIARDRITAIDVIADPDRLDQLELAVLG
jgi:Sigma-70, region 4